MEAVHGVEDLGVPCGSTVAARHERRRLVVEEAYRHRADLHRALMARFRSEDLVSDTVQETFARFLMVERVEEIANPRGYLFRMATNLTIDQMRRDRSSAFRNTVELQEDSHASEAPTPEESLLHTQLERLFDEALSELPQRARDLFHLHRFEGLSTLQIAQQFGISQRMVQKSVARVIKHFSQRLTNDWALRS